MDPQNKITGVVLAGGLARRMQGVDKGLVEYRSRPLVSYALAALAQVSDQVLINANRNFDAYGRLGFPVISDATQNFDGPLAGILAAMQQAGSGRLLVMPCDTPLIGAEHLSRLLSAQADTGADLAVAFDGLRLHSVLLVANVSLRPSLQDYLRQGQRKVEGWLSQHALVQVDFSCEPEAFANINTLVDLQNISVGPC